MIIQQKKPWTTPELHKLELTDELLDLFQSRVPGPLLQRLRQMVHRKKAAR